MGTEGAVQVKKLNPTTTEETLRNVFRAYGKVQRVAMNGKGGAHIVFAKRVSAPKAAEGADKSIIDGSTITVQFVPPFEKTNRPCRSYQAGKCKQGDKCKYTHIDASVGVSTQPPAVQPSTKQSSSPTCRYFMLGKCQHGASCKFSHVQPSASQKSTEITTPADRTCVECERKGVAQWQCTQCDESLYCDACNEQVHQSKVMSKHQRTKLQSNDPCAECTENAANVECLDCEVKLCASCNDNLHRFKTLQKHRRQPLESTGEKQPLQYVDSVPRLTLPSDSSDESDEEVEAPKKSGNLEVSVEKVSVKNTSAPLTTKPKDTTDKNDVSSESESEREEQAPAPKPKATVTKKTTVTKQVAPTVTKAKVTEKSVVSSESESSSESEDEAPPAPKPKATITKKPATVNKQVTPAQSSGKQSSISENSSHTLVKKIEAYHASEDQEPLHLSPDLNSFERLLAHDCAERLGLAHVSIGDGLERHITVGKGEVSVGEKRPRKEKRSRGTGRGKKKSKQ